MVYDTKQKCIINISHKIYNVYIVKSVQAHDQYMIVFFIKILSLSQLVSSELATKSRHRTVNS